MPHAPRSESAVRTRSGGNGALRHWHQGILARARQHARAAVGSEGPVALAEHTWGSSLSAIKVALCRYEAARSARNRPIGFGNVGRGRRAFIGHFTEQRDIAERIRRTDVTRSAYARMM